MNTNRFAGIFRLFIVLSIVALLAGCGGGGGGGGGDTPTPLPGESTYELSGTITKSGGGALESVTISLSGTSSSSTTTDASGNYSFTELANGSYTITPTLSGYVFNPVSQVFNVNSADPAAINFIATANSTPTYDLSGTVTKSGGVALPGVTITISGEGSGTATTDANGNYTFTVKANCSYTITPTLAWYTFTPVSLLVEVNDASATANFIATPSSTPTYSISGTVTKSGGGVLSGVTMTLGGVGSGAASTDGSGNYSFLGKVDGSYTVTPTLAGYTFNPASWAVNISGDNVTISFTASSTTPPVDPPIPPAGQPNLKREVAQDALYAVYGGIGYNDRLDTGDDALLYRTMVSNMNSIGIDLILKTITGDPKLLEKLGIINPLIPTFSTTFTSSGDGYTSTLTINRGALVKEYFPFNATLTVAFDGTGYPYGTAGKVYGPFETSDLTANFTGHFSVDLSIIVRTVSITAGNGLRTVEGGVTTYYDNWKLAYNVNYGADDPLSGLGNPTNLEFIPSSYNKISTQIYPDFRDYTVGGSFIINGMTFSFANGFRYEQKQYDYNDVRYIMMSANGQMSVPGLASNFLVSSTLNTSNPETNYTIITHVLQGGLWSNDWRSGTLILGDTLAVFNTGSVTFKGSAGSWTVPDWKTFLSIP